MPGGTQGSKRAAARAVASRTEPSRTVGPWAARLLRSLAETLEGQSRRRDDASAKARRTSAGTNSGSERGGDRHAGTHQDSLEGLLWTHLCLPEGAPEARLHVVSLAEIRQAFGREWARLSAKALMIAEAIIKANLTPGDRFCRRGDEAFLLLFSGNQPEDVERRLDIIVSGIRRQLLGAKADKAGGFGVRATNLTLAQVINGGLMLSAPSAAPTTQDNNAPISPSPSPNAASAAGTGIEAVAGMGGDGMSASDLAARIHRQISFSFAPVWSARAQRVENYVCLARREADYGTFQGTWVLNGGYGDPLALGVDLRAVDSAVADLRRLMKTADEMPCIILPLHLRSLCGEGGRRMLGKLESAITPNERPNIVFEIIGPAPNLPLGTLPQMIGTLKTLGRAVHVRAVPGAVDGLLPWIGKADAVGLDLNDIARHGADPRTRLRALRDFFKATSGAEAPVTRYLWDTRTMEEASLAVSLGASFLCGTAAGGEALAQIKAPFYLGRRHLGLDG